MENETAEVQTIVDKMAGVKSRREGSPKIAHVCPDKERGRQMASGKGKQQGERKARVPGTRTQDVWQEGGRGQVLQRSNSSLFQYNDS